jgi:AraC-like DNA-binding protein
MFPPEARTLSGDVASPQHLAELHLPPNGVRLPAPKRFSHLLILSLKGRVSCFHDGIAWHLEAEHHAWLVPNGEVVLRGAALGASHALGWRFDPTALPFELQNLLPSPKLGPLQTPAPITPSINTLLLALRGCPVAPALRNLWGTGKLIELLTLLLPPLPSVEKSTVSAPRLARVLHPGIRSALEFMAAQLDAPIGLPEIAAAAHASPSHLSRLFTAEFGHGPTIHLRRLRLDHAAALLRSGQANVTEAALACGYQSLGQFSRAFAEHHGRSPSALLPRNNGETFHNTG